METTPDRDTEKRVQDGPAGRSRTPAVRDLPFVVVANRLPVRRGRNGGARWTTSPGGLVSALVPILQRAQGGAWIGWTGRRGDAPDPFVHDEITNVPVPLSAEEARDCYEGFSNATLWPLYHGGIRTPAFRRDWWRSYREVNERFAAAAARTAGRGATVWVHDYHLQLVPGLLRERRPDLRIGFFLHIPFPPAELFSQLPWREPILDGLLGADVVGFQTELCAENFRRLARGGPGAAGGGPSVRRGDRTVVCGAFPISIDFDRFEGAAREPSVLRHAHRVRSEVGAERKVLLGIDRLDYTKGIPERLQALRELVSSDAVSPEECVLIQTAVPSRERVAEYRAVRQRVERLVGEINGEYASIGRPLVHYLRKSLPFSEMVGLYCAADVMVVTPLRDGMNLVAKEYVATCVDETGALVLSEFTGAAQELKDAFLVNPYDVDGMAAALLQAVRLPEDEQRKRMRSLRRSVRTNDVHRWARSFLTALGADASVAEGGAGAAEGAAEGGAEGGAEPIELPPAALARPAPPAGPPEGAAVTGDRAD